MTSKTTTGHRPSAFREHHGRTRPATSKLFAHLIDEWIELNLDPRTQQALRRFARLEPVLAGYDAPGDVVDAIDAADYETKEAMIEALLRLVQAGHHTAGRILLQQMLPLIGRLTKLTKLTKLGDGQDIPASIPPQWLEDRRHIAVAEFWDLINTVDVDRRRGHLIGNLSWGLYNRLYGRATENVPIPIGDIHQLEPVGWGFDTTDPGIDQGDTDGTSPHGHSRRGRQVRPIWEDSPTTMSDHYSLAEVIEWAVGGEIISKLDARLLTFIYIDRHSALEAAAEFQLTHDQTRQRCSRATRRIAGAIAKAQVAVA